MPTNPSGNSVGFTPLASPPQPTLPPTQLRQAEPQLSRTYYQDGRLLTAVDLNRDYAYLDQRLLDLGLALGDGIVQGLETTLLKDNRTISVAQGRGIAPSGRVIAYAGTPLTADLLDNATLATLNDGTFSGLIDGLYVVTLLHSQQPSGIAEVFPQNLRSTRITYETIVDHVEIALVALPQAAPAANAYQARASLAALFAGGSTQPALPSDSLALGVVAIRSGQVAWFDSALLRHRLRPSDAANAVQQDLSAQYLSMYPAWLLNSGAANVSIFAMLPPSGLMPRSAIDPIAGTQTFFSAQFEVAIVPARADEVPSLLAQIAAEAPIDLRAATPAHILVLVALPPSVYATLAPVALGGAPVPAPFTAYPSLAMPRIDPLILRLPSRQPQAPTPNSAPAWAQPQIWGQAPPDLTWLVRPTDGGLGGAKAAQLAQGFAAPTSTPVPTPSVTPPPPTTPPPTTPPPITTSSPPISSPPISSPQISSPPISSPPISSPPISLPPVSSPPISRPPISRAPPGPPTTHPI